ncbi:hypothetical protein [Roseivirga sp. E12]|uniref:hypothetical protein n=1 Tax=Roseivirga sp. E12 TaxID=2819237 RepID=UPI001ABC911B|nr:hypothetical protein [Roseivirga sp. E12]MBO3700481.1 hypothetical protein [Roseivirga sp. E12]
MNLHDPVHKKVIGISFIVFSALWLLSMAFFDTFMDFFVDKAIEESGGDPDVFFIFDIINSVFWGITVLFFIPRLVLGIALVSGQKWANIPSLVYGVVSLINFPVGTALGVYCIMVFTAKKPDEDY